MTGQPTIERVNLLRVFGRRRVRRWRYSGWHCHMAFEASVSLGWHPDGWWFVEDTREHLAWVVTGPDPATVRAAAEAEAEALMAAPWEHGGSWAPTIAEYEPGVLPQRAAEVPEWPPGHRPDS